MEILARKSISYIIVYSTLYYDVKSGEMEFHVVIDSRYFIILPTLFPEWFINSCSGLNNKNKTIVRPKKKRHYIDYKFIRDEIRKINEF